MPKIYITKAGDTWDIIAKDQLGSEYYSNQLVDANFHYSETLFFAAGIKLTIPDIMTNSAINLPPWKR